MALIRTFLAVEISDEVRSKAESLIGTLSGLAEGVRWVRPENLHITLQFLGEVEDRELNDICRRVAQAASQVPAFSCDCRGIGAFPDLRRPSTVWIGVDGPEDMLELHRRIEGAMAELGFPRERRPYRPHLTLGRIRRRTGNLALAEMIGGLSDTDFGSFSVNEVVAFSSELERGGPVYTTLARCPLS